MWPTAVGAARSIVVIFVIAVVHLSGDSLRVLWQRDVKDEIEFLIWIV